MNYATNGRISARSLMSTDYRTLYISSLHDSVTRTFTSLVHIIAVTVFRLPCSCKQCSERRTGYCAVACAWCCRRNSQDLRHRRQQALVKYRSRISSQSMIKGIVLLFYELPVPLLNVLTYNLLLKFVYSVVI